MKKHCHVLVATLALAAAFIINVPAQTAAQIVVANIPFTFNVGSVSLPAGKFTITVVNPSSDRKILLIRNRDGDSSAMIQTNAVTGKVSDDAKLVFQRYGDRYFFAQAQMAGDSTSLAAIKSDAERALKQPLASGTKQSVIVVVGK